MSINLKYKQKNKIQKEKKPFQTGTACTPQDLKMHARMAHKAATVCVQAYFQWGPKQRQDVNVEKINHEKDGQNGQ